MSSTDCCCLLLQILTDVNQVMLMLRRHRTLARLFPGQCITRNLRSDHEVITVLRCTAVFIVMCHPLPTRARSMGRSIIKARLRYLYHHMMGTCKPRRRRHLVSSRRHVHVLGKLDMKVDLPGPERYIPISGSRYCTRALKTGLRLVSYIHPSSRRCKESYTLRRQPVVEHEG